MDQCCHALSLLKKLRAAESPDDAQQQLQDALVCNESWNHERYTHWRWPKSKNCTGGRYGARAEIDKKNSHGSDSQGPTSMFQYQTDVSDYDEVILVFDTYKAGFLKRASRRNVHRALCSLLQPDTDGTRVLKCRQLSQETRGLDPVLFLCRPSAVGGGPISKQHWVKSSCLLGSTHVSVYTHPSPP